MGRKSLIQIGVRVNWADIVKITKSIWISGAQNPADKVGLDYLQFCRMVPVFLFCTTFLQGVQS